MEQKDKELLLKDLCARLPYEVILLAPNGKVTYQTDGNTGAELLVEEGFKPYLRPMSSMTEEEWKEYHELCDSYYGVYFDSIDSIDWLNKKMFDYRMDDEGQTMIEKSLALEAPKDMYK